MTRKQRFSSNQTYFEILKDQPRRISRRTIIKQHFQDGLKVYRGVKRRINIIQTETL